MKNIFSGRINRITFLVFQIIYSIIIIILQDARFPYINLVYLALIFFAFTTVIKRLHDMGKTGWWALFIFIPLANVYWGLKLLFGAGDFADNRFGPSPQKGIKLL